MHLDATLARLPASLVAEALRPEVGAELAVDPHQDVAIERRRDARARRRRRAPAARDPSGDPPRSSSAPPGPHCAATRRRNPTTSPLWKFPMVDPGKYTARRRGPSPWSGSASAVVKSPQTGRTPRAGKLRRSRTVASSSAAGGCRPARRRPACADVCRSRRVFRLEPEPYSMSDAAFAEERRHRGRVRLHDPQLGAGGVVLVELADPLEQLRAPRVVQPLARDLLLLLPQPPAHLRRGSRHARLVRAPAAGRRARAVPRQASRASRIPENCHRASGRKKLR